MFNRIIPFNPLNSQQPTHKFPSKEGFGEVNFHLLHTFKNTQKERLRFESLFLNIILMNLFILKSQAKS